MKRRSALVLRGVLTWPGVPDLVDCAPEIESNLRGYRAAPRLGGPLRGLTQTLAIRCKILFSLMF